MPEARASLIISVKTDTAGAQQAKQQLGGVENALAGIKKAAGALGLGIGIAAIGQAALQTAKESVGLAAAFEQNKIAFENMLGSGQKAKAFLDDLREFAARTPFEFTDLVTASKRMIAFGFEAEKILPMMTDIGDAVAGLGGNSDMINRVTLALGQMSAKGKVSAEEMLQLTEVGIPAWRYLAESVGVSTAEVQKMTQKGLIPASAAVDALLAGMRQDFGGLMAQQSQTAQGAFSNFEDAVTSLKTTLGEVLLPTVAEATRGLTDMVNALNFLATSSGKIRTAVEDHAREVARGTMSYEEYETELRRVAREQGLFITQTGDLLDMKGRVVIENYLLSESERDVAQHMDEYAEMVDHGVRASLELATATEDTTAALGTAWSPEVTGKARDYKDIVAELVDRQRDLAAAQSAWADQTSTVLVRALEDAGVKGQAYADALAAIDELTGSSLTADQEKEQAIANVTKEYKDGKISVEEYQAALNLMLAKEMPETKAAFDEASKLAGDLGGGIDELADKAQRLDGRAFRYSITQDNYVNNYTNFYTGTQQTSGSGAGQTALGGGRASGGPVTAGAAYVVGERGPEMFVPNQNGTIVPNGGFGDSYNITVNSAAGAALLMAMVEERKRARFGRFMGN